MPEAVYRVMTMLSTLVAPLPIGTNLGLLHLLWMLVSGRLLGSRGAILPGLSDLGLTDGEVRRAWAAQGTTPMTMGVDEFTRYLNDDITKWAHIVKVSGAKAE